MSKPGWYALPHTEKTVVLEKRLALVSAEIARGEYELLSHAYPKTNLGFWAIEEMMPDGLRAVYRHSLTHGIVILSCARERDGRHWLHVSVSHPKRTPSYQEMADIKETFIGPDKFAYFIFVPEEQHVNDAEFALHLWHCLDAENGGAITPDFRRGGTL